MKTNQLRNRIITHFIGLTLLMSVLYGILSFVFAYNVEDRFFYLLLKDEQTTVQRQIAENVTPDPKLDFIKYYPSVDVLPIQVKLALQKTPNQREFSTGDGLYYHLHDMQPGYLVAEVSDHLVVRQFKEEMIYLLFILLSILMLISIAVAITSHRLAKQLLKPLDKIMTILDNAPVEKLPQDFAKQFKNDEIGTFALTLESALARIKAFIDREQNFTRDVSHELRTPITISQGALTLLQKTTLDPQQKELVQRINNAQLQIEQSLEVLLALAREEKNTIMPCRLLPLVEDSILQQYQYLADPNIGISINIDKKQLVTANQTQLIILLNNLIGNAFKYTVHGIVNISYYDNTLCISDTGLGICDTLRNSVLEAGVKGKQSTGLGQGLNIVKRLCEQLKINFSINSNSNGTAIKLKFTKK
ncbi:sensor histidine kinase [Pseudoalteromonas citrea]|uniref:histidine kinase n=1 Tax=Pseudoalteromonas citrea TaxID=43655 RepID=A0A5S3XNG9_9GAMM|nr:HAMP domain-containing sensor histidine kinase [Pseudoalteromonas citrea]TMP40113.1 sensor histidine kinase [Pseudoalteromonas citrea]TMP56828.1 sensor histidine kinase [Pseudoalteromonas citrea]